MSNFMDFSRLPLDIQKLFTSYLSPEDLLKATPSSKLFHKMMQESPAWKMAAERLKLKNVTKENAKSKVLDHFNTVDIIKGIVHQCIPHNEKAVIPKSDNIATLQEEIAKKFQNNNGPTDFHNSLSSIATEVNFRLPANLKSDSFSFKNDLLYLEHLITVIKGNKDKAMADKICREIQEGGYVGVNLVFVKGGVLDYASADDFLKCIASVMNLFPFQDELTLLSELFKALQNHSTISKEEKVVIIKNIFIHFADNKYIPDRKFLEILMKQGLATPDEAMQKVILFFIKEAKASSSNALTGVVGSLFKEYLKHSPLPIATLKSMVEGNRDKNDYYCNAACDFALKFIDEVFKEKSAPKKK